jgi:GH25 family lysozyme M1 (1,4-beta-N-acetylmuramidase)
MVASAQGEDRSNFQSVTNWNGLNFGFCKATEGTTFTDSTFAANWANLKAQGLPRGAYHFFHPSENAAAQAAFFLATVKAHGLEAGDMLVIDSELSSGIAADRLATVKARAAYHAEDDLNVSTALVDSATAAFLADVQANIPAGVALITYTDLTLASEMQVTASRFPLLWIAWPSSSAPANCGAFSRWLFWQWGIVGGIDRDAFNGTAADLAAWIKSLKDDPMQTIPGLWSNIISVEHEVNGDIIVTGIAGVGVANEIPTLFSVTFSAATSSWGTPVEIGFVQLGG